MSNYAKYILFISFPVLFAACGGSKKTMTNHALEKKSPQFEHDLFSKKARQIETGKEDEIIVISRDDDSEADIPPGKEAEADLHDALDAFVKDWYGTPHRMGGNTRHGVDCSGFVIQCYTQVFNSSFIGRRAEDLFGETTPVKRSDLTFGDLVFFKIRGKRIDHVGVYMGDGDFAHASSSRGVMISNLNEVYYTKRFFMGGRKL